jgi:UV DNA damage endonuclease
MRLGFAAKVTGRPGLKEADGRRWQNNPHLSVSLTYLEAIFDYLRDEHITMYRISSRIAPYITHPQLPQFHHQIEECAEQLARLGERARAQNLRLSMHPDPFVVLNSPHEAVYAAALRDLDYHARFLDALGAGPEAVVVLHGGGVFGDKAAAMARFVDRYLRLPEHARRRIVLENDEKSYSVPDIVVIHQQTGVPLVLDNLHHAVNNPDHLTIAQAADLCLPTWPQGVTPKVHFSSPRREDRVVRRRDKSSGKTLLAEVAPLASQHADWVDVDEFVAFLGETARWHYDVMLEAKQKDSALLRLRGELAARGIVTE